MKRLSFSEILASPRIVKKFSVTRRWAEKPNAAVLPSGLVLAETGQKGRYFWTEGSTVTLHWSVIPVATQPDGNRVGSLVAPGKLRSPLRALFDGTVIGDRKSTRLN